MKKLMLKKQCLPARYIFLFQDCIDCVHTIFKIKCVEPVEKASGSDKLDCRSINDCFESIVFQC